MQISRQGAPERPIHPRFVVLFSPTHAIKEAHGTLRVRTRTFERAPPRLTPNVTVLCDSQRSFVRPLKGRLGDGDRVRAAVCSAGGFTLGKACDAAQTLPNREEAGESLITPSFYSAPAAETRFCFVFGWGGLVNRWWLSRFFTVLLAAARTTVFFKLHVARLWRRESVLEA